MVFLGILFIDFLLLPRFFISCSISTPGNHCHLTPNLTKSHRTVLPLGRVSSGFSISIVNNSRIAPFFSHILLTSIVFIRNATFLEYSTTIAVISHLPSYPMSNFFKHLIRTSVYYLLSIISGNGCAHRCHFSSAIVKPIENYKMRSLDNNAQLKHITCLESCSRADGEPLGRVQTTAGYVGRHLNE